ncbi:hypothetical protein RJ639_027901 [Escallonia herrerae]|uniref:Uncharacterized protein n=1 Tax=Escallonia herrerae TaxID=1293975 RepID=A0AA89BR17_9ASTE|nr:hypothetical protein RJ639_027901 [Escallonia herrerae]
MAKLGESKEASELGKTLKFLGLSFSKTGKKGTIQGYSLSVSWLGKAVDDGASVFENPVTVKVRELKILNDNSSVAVNSRIFYLVGTEERLPLDKVTIYDTSNLALSGLRPILLAKIDPLASVMEGKIVVFDGSDDYFAKPWVEVFDLCTQEWMPLASSPLHPTCQIFMSAFLHDSIEIVVDSGWHHEGVDSGCRGDSDCQAAVEEEEEEECSDGKITGGRFLIYRIKQKVWVIFYTRGIETGGPFLEFEIYYHEALVVGQTFILVH